MATSLTSHLQTVLPELRFEPTLKRVRARRDGRLVAESTRAILVWEPMRVVPSYAVPLADLRVEATPVAPGPTPDLRPVGFGPDSPPLLDPSVPFAVHTADGQPLAIATDAAGGNAFRLADPDLADYVVLDFGAFSWSEEDEAIFGHPRSPFHRIDVRASSRHVRIEHDGVLLADSSRPRVLFEGAFPLPRFYLPPEDVSAPLSPGRLATTCAYKGHATHYDVTAGDVVIPDLAWSYEQPIDDAIPVAGLICFYQERLDLWLDGQPVERVRTPWSG